MIHIVFEEANADVLQKSFGLDNSMTGEIIILKDEYAVGPIDRLHTPEGIERRLNWWKEILKDGHYDGIAEDGHVDDNKEVQSLKQRLADNPEEQLWIWAGQNKHDVSGYYWLISQLRPLQGRIFILYLNNLPFINDKGNIFFPQHLFQIPPKEFIKAKKLARPVTITEFDTDTEEWERLAAQNKGVRLLEGGKKLVQKDYDYYDDEFLKYVGANWQKVARVLQQYFSKSKITTGDAYLIWRLKVLAQAGKIELQGDTRNMKDYEVRLMQGADSANEPAEV